MQRHTVCSLVKSRLQWKIVSDFFELFISLYFLKLLVANTIYNSATIYLPSVFKVPLISEQFLHSESKMDGESSQLSLTQRNGSFLETTCLSQPPLLNKSRNAPGISCLMIT